MGLYEGERLGKPLVLGSTARYKILAVETGDEFAGIGHIQGAFDILAHAFGRCGGHGEANGIGQTLAQVN